VSTSVIVLCETILGIVYYTDALAYHHNIYLLLYTMLLVLCYTFPRGAACQNCLHWCTLMKMYKIWRFRWAYSPCPAIR